ncbi:MAG: hypothetical protein JJ866_16745 [Roseibium sp.]|uniref:hypothetical protein n=1 Tax=Roseibium sp. TaxID=1936156 RepID=UPI001B0E418F|nr:hypothetical protein [Roseibium sp.]MBO6893592.1 hypothetical protein [Roseibium sp.]MBO6930248.1 hypothetical protein [Roseibium sp.]
MINLLLVWLATLLLLMVFNRIRGAAMSSITDRLPGQALFYVAGFVVLGCAGVWILVRSAQILPRTGERSPAE